MWEDRGPAVQGKLAGWGEQVFGAVFGLGPARDAYQRARDKGLEVVFRSADPGLLGLPWELMHDGAGPVALGAGGISRSLPVAGGAGTLEVPGGRLRVLMVISRPGGTQDVGYQMVARPLLERLDAVWSPCTLVDRFPLCRIYIRNVNRLLKTHRTQFPQAALFPDAVVIPLDVVKYRGPGLFGIPPQMLVDELFLDRGVE